MFGLDNTSGVSVMPPIADKLNANPLWFTEGGGGVSPSYPGKDWFNAIQAEFVNFIIASGLTPSKTDLTQITQAVLKSIQKSSSSFATDTGAANAYVVSLTPALVAPRAEGQVIRFKVTNPNNGACTVNDGIGVVPLVGLALSALQGGEMIAGGDAWIQWHPYVGTGSYVLLFCSGASMQVPAGTKPFHAVNKSQLDAVKQSLYVEVSLANGAMTWTLPKQTLRFRNTTLTNGAVIDHTLSADLTLTIPQGATGGSLSGVLANLVPTVFYNSGNPVLGFSNLAGGLDLSESGLLSATAISASANSASVAYASVAVTNSPYIVAGLVQSTQAAAGTWATQPNVAPKNTNLAVQIGGVGYSAPLDVSASRALGTTYYNTSSKPKKVKVSVSVLTAVGSTFSLIVSGVVVDSTGFGGTTSAVTRYHNVEWIVLPGGSYSVSGTTGSSIIAWIEA